MEKNKHIKTESKQEIRFDLHVVFNNGKVLYLCDDVNEIISYLEMWNDEIDYAIIKKNSIPLDF